MPVATTRRLDKVVFSGGAFSQISQQDWDFGIQEIMEKPAGELTPTFRGNESQKPVITFTTSDLKTALASIGSIGADLGQVDTYFKQVARTSNVARATTGHELIRIEDCLAYITSIRLSHTGKAEASVVLVAGYDGVNEPFQYTASVALSGTHGAASLWGVGPCAINGTSLGAIKEIDIQTGVTLLREGGESELYDTFIAIEQTDPIVTITTLHSVNWGTLGLNGVSLNGTTGLSFYARKRGPQGPVANITAEHILFTGLRGLAVPLNASGQGSAAISDQIRCSLNSTDGFSAALTGAVDQAIS